MGAIYCTVTDIEKSYRELTDEEEERVEALAETVSAELRLYALKRGRDLDAMIAESEDFRTLVTAVATDTVMRILNQNAKQEGMSQFSQAAGGYSISGTFLVPGGGSLILNRDLKRLGLNSMGIGVIDFYGVDSRN